MLRWYLVIVVVAVGIASMLGRVPNGRAPADRVIMTNSGAGSASESSADVASLDPLDNGIVLTRDPNGYFYADVQINNGAPLHMIVDTGATVVALSRSDAEMAGLAVPIGMNEIVGKGADGAIRGQQVTLDRVTLGNKTVGGVPALVLNSGGQSLLGQSFLSQFASVHIENDKMILR